MIDDLSSGRAERVAAAATLEVVDISDRAALDRVIDLAKPGAIFHLGAQSSVTVSVADPRRDCEVNVAGTLNVLEAARRHEAPVVFTSTGGALYGNDAPMPTPRTRIRRRSLPRRLQVGGESYVTTWTRAHGLAHAVCASATSTGRARAARGGRRGGDLQPADLARRAADAVRPRRTDARLCRRRRRGAGAVDGTRSRRRLQHRDRRRDRRHDALRRAAGGGGHLASAGCSRPCVRASRSTAAWTARAPARRSAGRRRSGCARGWRRPITPSCGVLGRTVVEAAIAAPTSAGGDMVVLRGTDVERAVAVEERGCARGGPWADLSVLRRGSGL